MSKVDDELTRRLRRAERPVDGDGVFEGLARRRSHRERVRRVQAGLLAFAVLTATAGGFVFLRQVFDADERDTGVSPSPDVLPANGQIVFAREDDEGLSHLFTSQADGTGAHRIAEDASEGFFPAVAPDGATIAFSYRLEEPGLILATMPLAGGAVTKHTSGGVFATDPAWAPEGDRVAYVASGIDSSSLYVADIRFPGSKDALQHLLEEQSGEPQDPAWSPDGSGIAFAFRSRTDEGLASIRPDGTGFRWLLRKEGGQEAPAWSPDGSRIAFLQTGDIGQEIRTITQDGRDEQLLATWPEGSLETDLAWAPDGTALLVSDGTWIYRVETASAGDPQENFVRLMEGRSPSWQPLPAGSLLSPTPTPEPTVSPSPQPAGRDIGLGFNLCHLQRLGGIDFLGDGTSGTAWTGNKTVSDGACPGIEDDRYGVAVDFTGDGIADSWSGETIKHCTGCEPFKAVDLNGDGAEDLIVTVSYFSIMQYGLYTVMPVDGDLEVVPFRIGEPGHPQHSLDPGAPFTFWVGGDAGSSDYFYCDRLPTFWLTGTESPIDGGAGDVTTWHETHVMLGTEGTAHILDAETYTVPYGTLIDHQHTTSKPDCGLGVDIQR